MTLKNRMVVCALTRQRAQRQGAERGTPNELHVEYYSKRAADAGMVLTECSWVSKNGDAFPGSTGIANDKHEEGWKRVTEAVHKQNGCIFLQIWHGGRAVHPNQADGERTIGPSPKPINGKIWVNNAFVPHVAPSEATKDDIKRVVEDFRKGAKRAKRAGFDGLELHGANGYIIDQFLRTRANERTDEYGGSIENRSRLCLEVLDQLIAVFGSTRVGIKLSPVNDYNDMADEDPVALTDYLIEKFNEKDLGFVELTEGFSLEGRDTQLRREFYKDRPEKSFREIFKKKFKNVWVTNYALTQETGNKAL